MNCLANAQYDYAKGCFVIKENGITYYLSRKHVDDIKYKINGRRPNITLKEWYIELPADQKKTVMIESDRFYDD